METRKRPSIKLTGGPHGIPRAVVYEVQRGRLIDATVDVVAEEGYLDATVHKILKRAGISRRTFYEIFADKQACFVVAYNEAVDHILGLVRGACREGDAPERRIENGLRALLELVEREPKVARTCVVEVMAAGSTARERRAQTMEQFTGMVADTLEARCDSRSEALLRARVLTGGVHEMIYDALARGDVEGIAELAEEVVASHLAPPEAVHGSVG
jgi:AcrR family transcriptional regulator